MKGAHVSSAFESLCAGVPTEPHEAGAFRASCDKRYLTTVPCRGSFAQGGVTMRDCSTNRAGFDRVLMAVAATFLAVSATTALAGPSDTPRASAAELAIDAAIPRPEPANVPPPDHRRLQDRFHRVDARSNQGNREAERAHLHRNDPRPRTQAGRNRHRACEDQRHRDPAASGCNDDARDRHGAGSRTSQGACKGCEQCRPGRSAGRRQDCAKCWPPNRCAISIARTSARRSRSSIRRVSTRRSGPRPEN